MGKIVLREKFFFQKNLLFVVEKVRGLTVLLLIYAGSRRILPATVVICMQNLINKVKALDLQITLVIKPCLQS